MNYIIPIFSLVFSSQLFELFFAPVLAFSIVVCIFCILRRLCRV